MEKPHTSTTASDDELQSYTTKKRLKMLCTILLGIQLFISLAISVILGISVRHISHDPYLPGNVQIDLKNLSDTHYMSLVGCVLTTINAIVGLFGVRKGGCDMLKVYGIFGIIIVLIKIASSCLYIIWRSKFHAILVVAPCFVDILCMVWIYLYRNRLKEITHFISV
ncbi:hypothetical protein K7432_005257 [Basidiobolus ranarum]|uniref:Uncharacterized protein n=1 Tax=Basidiobolus ranarum TaxID=34480 RepID=A0ABR2W3I1_9FUNG